MHCIRALPGSQSRYFASAARGFFASDDTAAGWARAQNGCQREYFHSFIFFPPDRPQDSPVMLLASADRSPGYWNRPEGARSAIYRSADGAQSWHWVGEGLADEMPSMVNMLVNHPSERNGAFAGLGGRRSSGGTLMVTHDRGDSWAELPIEVPPTIGLWAAAE
jgi:photosystem II stability/assembly factor-like uncharacterized protein